MTVSHIEIVDHGKTVNAYEDKPHGRILAVLQRPRVYSKEPYVITIPRTQARVERKNYALAYRVLEEWAHIEHQAINP